MSIFGYTVKIIIFGVIEDITELPQFPITVTSSCPLKNCYAPSRRRVERVEDVFDTARLDSLQQPTALTSNDALTSCCCLRPQYNSKMTSK